MKYKVKEIQNFNGSLLIPLPKGYGDQVDKLCRAAQAGKELLVEIKKVDPKRSLDANRALWGMLDQIAAAVNSTPEEVYLECLRKYGKRRYIAVMPEDVAYETAKHKIAEVREEYYIYGTKVFCMEVIDGSSTYTTSEFSRLLDGVISDAKELGIDFISQADRDRYVEEWRTQNAPPV